MRIAIIGAGASGLMAAVTASEINPDATITLIERNRGIGRKLLLTGGGRCNLTTGLDDMSLILKKYPRGGRFLNSAMRQFPPAAARQWFEGRGIALKTEADNRVFPQSDDGGEVIAMFEGLLRNPRLRLLVGITVTGITRTASGFKVETHQMPPIECDRLILTTGGQAYRQTGSVGDGYAFAQSLGHEITELAPSLSALKLAEKWPKKLAGLSWPYAKLCASDARSEAAEGPFLFTHHGITGPAVFALSSLIAQRPSDEKNPIKIELDLFPQRTAEELTERVKVITAAQPARSLLNVIIGLPLPRSLTEAALAESDIPNERKAGQLSGQERHRLVQLLKRWTVSVIGRSAGEEFVTAGGVKLEEVNPSTMESKIVPGLFFAGELLDVDAFTGGFNLQAAWATGRLAGQKAAGDVGGAMER